MPIRFEWDPLRWLEEDEQIYAVRTFYDRPYTIDEKPQLFEALDDWNRRTLWPKIYTHTHDDGIANHDER